ncbi:MAG: Methionine import ATP-binding protein MetN [Syntrophorhabdus sp. PtaU1.Bin058]|nr:MAG: Methionine import ATP-binding protein MetN [Syntrophorhabdus sp. PtaU1.Bin058]
MITARNLTKSFGDTHVLRGLDVHIERGGIYGLAGRSGAGKSTLLRCINGLERYDSGSLIVDGIDVKTLSGKAMMAFRKNIGMVFQHFSLLERLNVYDNVALPLRCWKYKSAFIDRKVRDLLEIVGIPEKIRQRPRELSGGQKQRVAIARALTMDPHILLCDEATSALDPKTSKAIIDLLKQINGQMEITIVFVTHQMSVIRGLCKEIAIIENGKVAVSGTVEDVFRQQPGALKNLIGEGDAGPGGEGMKTITLLLPREIAGPLIARMAVQLGCDLTIQGGDPLLSGEDPEGLTISFPEKDRLGVEGYLAGHNVAWKDADTQNTRSSDRVDAYGKAYETQVPGIRPDLL